MTLVSDHSGTAVANQPASRSLQASGFARVSAQHDKSDTNFTDLLSVAVSLPKAGALVATFAASFFEMVSVVGARAEFQLMLDGTPIERTANNLIMINEPESCSLVHRTGVLNAGPHTIAVQWRRASNDGSIRVNPIDNGGITGAQLSVQAAA